MTEQRALWYFADPMCSWCWGFAPVISAIRDEYAERLPLRLIMGGLRPGTREPVTARFREEILHHWREVQRRSGQPFKFDGALPDGFVYDTEPACRAVVGVSDLNREAAFAYFKSVQDAFYADGQDVTRAQTLARLAEPLGIDPERFLARFDSEDAKQATWRHFRQTAESGVRGFPTAVLQDNSGFALLTHGYAPLEQLRPTIEQWLARA